MVGMRWRMGAPAGCPQKEIQDRDLCKDLCKERFCSAFTVLGVPQGPAC